MNRMFRCNSSASSSSHLTSIPDIVNQEEQEYQDLNSSDFQNWNIPKIPVKEIYRSRLIQVAIKPLSRTGLNSSVLLSLRDARFTVYSDSLLGLMESSLHNGPVYFNCYPDLPLSLKDKNILKALTLNIQTAGAITNMLEGSHPLALIYRIYYKCMKTNLNIHALVKSPKDKTVLIQSNTNANIQVPKTISWNDITLPTSWVSENDSYPHKMQNDTVDLDYIKQYLDGTVRISFDQQRINPPLRIKELSRSSSSVSLPRHDKNLINPHVKLRGIETSSQISKPCYSTQSNFDDSETSPGSPTLTDFEGTTPPVNPLNQVDPALRVLTRITNDDSDDEYDELYEEFKSKKNKQKRRNWRSSYSSSQQDKMIDQWKQYMENNNDEIYFFDYLEKIEKITIPTKPMYLSSVCSTSFQKTCSIESKGLEVTKHDNKLVKISDTTVQDLKHEVKIAKKDIKKLKESEIENWDKNIKNSQNDKKEYYQKWYTKVKLVIRDYQIEVNALIDTGADLNCIAQGLVPTMYFHKTTAILRAANNSKMDIEYKLPNAHICQDKICFQSTIVLVPDLTDNLILGTPFICLLYPFTTNEEGLFTKPFGQQVMFKFLTKPELVQLNYLAIDKLNLKKNQLKFLQEEINYKKVEEQLTTTFLAKQIEDFKEKLETKICAKLPSAFWHRKKHIVTLPYIKKFNESQIPTKSRPIQMNPDVLETCKNEIDTLLANNIIQKSKSPWSCPAFYVNKNTEKERGVPRLVINYKPLNAVLEWIRYPIPNKKDLISRLSKAVIFSKFDLKSGFWQIQLHPDDCYKTAFTTPFGHYEWNVMPFGLKNAPSEFQNIMNEIFNPFSHFIIVYIDDVLIFSKSIDDHWKHLNSFVQTIKHNGLVISAPKIKLFQTKIRFLGYDIHQSTITPISRAIQFADKFPDEILDKNQLQRFLGSLNYIAEFYKDLRKICQPLFDRLKTNPPPWSSTHSDIVRKIKQYVKTLPCLGIPTVNSFKIIQTDASEIGYGGILLQRISPNSAEQIVRFHSGRWNTAQSNYSTIKKEILSIVLCISKFQDDILNQNFLVRVDCKSAKFVLEKDVENIASKQIFARWQSILSIFDFKIEYIKGSQNSIPDFLTREFLLGK
ncbi:hypothetical protein RHMOL_Rhmol01G0124200 [Rhododendron molle]|uniref:Uncharacterized protein n=1 Tax=Rhododendron molle TaxID=49168 RepID=A0ACC0Q0E5_RHOML|nr:hypothetical protein RHMOL_Rhmol01G0124200 [Rhododendron molle]